MVGFTSVIGAAALFATYASALPRPGWASDGSSMGSGSYGSWSQGDSSSGSSGYGSSGSGSSGSGSSGYGSSNSGSSWGSSGNAGSGYGSAMSSDAMMASSAMATDTMMASSAMATDTMMASSAMATDTMMTWSAMATDTMMTSSAMATETMMTSSAMATETMMTSSAMATETMMSSDVMMTTTAMASETSMAYATSTSAAYTMTASYGSGSTNWGGDGYSDCVQQCVASYATMATVTASATATATASAMASGTGTTHTIYVAPTQGVLRMVPFAVNATPGDTLYWIWGANNHTVTKSSELSPCNTTTDGTAFATGEQDMGATFTETVNDTNPVFYYCATPGHCEKGMFGVINPPSVDNNANTSVASMMPAMMANSSTLSAMYAASNISSNPVAASWGDNMDMGAMPEWSQSLMAENVVYTRAFLAANPSVLSADGTVNLGAANGQFAVPQDISDALSSSSGSSSASASASGSPSGTAAAAGIASASSSGSSASATATGSTSGARANVASGALLGVAAIAVTFLAL